MWEKAGLSLLNWRDTVYITSVKKDARWKRNYRLSWLIALAYTT